MTILELLKQDHDKVKELLDLIESDAKTELFEEFKNEIQLHNEAEEKIFYTPLKDKLDDLEIIIDANFEEHDLTSNLIEKISDIETDEEWWQLFSVIKKSLEAHIYKEENDIFNLAQQYFSEDELNQMANDFKEMKMKLQN